MALLLPEAPIWYFKLEFTDWYLKMGYPVLFAIRYTLSPNSPAG